MLPFQKTLVNHPRPCTILISTRLLRKEEDAIPVVILALGPKRTVPSRPSFLYVARSWASAVSSAAGAAGGGTAGTHHIA